MRPELGQVCQSLMVLSYCTPGSAQAQAALAQVALARRTEAFAAERMNRGIRQALAGKRVEEV